MLLEEKPGSTRKGESSRQPDYGGRKIPDRAEPQEHTTPLRALPGGAGKQSPQNAKTRPSQPGRVDACGMKDHLLLRRQMFMASASLMSCSRKSG